MEAKKIYNAEMFIIPNSLRREKIELEDSKVASYFWDQYERKAARYFGEEAARRNKSERILAQVWICSKESDNWADHGCPIDGEHFVQNLPVEIIRGMKEGDTIELDLPEHNAILRLTAKQQGYRYERFGKFEDVLKRLGAA